MITEALARLVAAVFSTIQLVICFTIITGLGSLVYWFFKSATIF